MNDQQNTKLNEEEISPEAIDKVDIEVEKDEVVLMDEMFNNEDYGSWEVCDEYAAQIPLMLKGVVDQVKGLVNTPGLIECVSEERKKELNIRIHGLSRDAHNILVDLKKLAKKHKDKKGEIKDEDEYIESMMIANEYLQLMEKVSSVVIANSAEIVAELEIAYNKMKEAEKAEENEEKKEGGERSD